MNRRKFMKQAGQGAVIFAAPSLLQSCGTKKRPNILYIMSDDHGYQAISCYNGKLNQTPNIDRLANDGVRFETSFCTNSLCAPSRAVMLTGKFSNVNGLIDNRVTFDGSQQTFPKLLQKAGYQTAMIGKWHLKSTPTGFDYWHILPGQGHYYNPEFIEMGERKKVTGYVTDLITDYALNWLERRDQEKPFCMLLHHKAPHRNWMPDAKHLSMYDDVEIPMPETFYDDYATRSEAAKTQEMEIVKYMYMAYDLKVPPVQPPELDSPREKTDRKSWQRIYNRMNAEQKKVWDAEYGPKNRKFHQDHLQGKELDKWKFQRYIRDYLRCIASVDDNIGRVLDYLDEHGLTENTIVIYTSDQGFYLGEHGWFDKRFMYEESLRMPLIIRYPEEIKAAVNTEDMVQNVDFAPTFLDYAGVKIPADMQGRSLRSLLAGRTPADWRKAIYYHYFEYPAVHMVKRHYGVRTKRYKLIHFYYDIDAWELYDLQKDPHELNNVYDNPEYASVVKELTEELQKLREKYKDTDVTRFLPPKSVTVNHKAKGCKVTLKHPYSAKYSGGGANALTDGVQAPGNLATYNDNPVWQGFEQVDLDAVIDLKKEREIKRVATGFLQEIGSWIFFPTVVEYFISKDGTHFTSIGSVKNKVAMKNPRTMKRNFGLPVKNIRARYLRVYAKNVGICPSWHPGAGGKAWLFADEVVVK